MLPPPALAGGNLNNLRAQQTILGAEI